MQPLVWGVREAPEATRGQRAQVAHATGAPLRGALADALGVLLDAERREEREEGRRGGQGESAVRKMPFSNFNWRIFVCYVG